MEYNDNTLLTFGKYKFTALCRVPPDYLFGLLERRHSVPDKELIKYIERNLESIRARQLGKVISPKLEIDCKITGSHINLICKNTNKIIFPSEKDAKFELKRIQNATGNNKKPIRSYPCKYCGGWHLTSKEFNPLQTNGK